MAYQGNSSWGGSQGGYGGGGGGGGGGSYGGSNRKRISIPSGSVGRLIGRGGSKIRELQDQSGCQIKVLQDEDVGAGMTCVELSYSRDSDMDYAQQLINQVVEDADNNRGGGGGGGRYGGQSRGGGGGYGGSQNGGGYNASIPENCVGLIIGKGGARIKDIEYKVGCSVRVKNDGNGNHYAQVQGTEEQYKQVQEIIDEAVERQKSRGAY